jgi:ferredoxin
MIRKIIQIAEEKCTGCGLCAEACHEGAIGIVNGKAKLLRDDYCDGLGNCLPACPTGAISFTEREAAQYDEEAVKKNVLKKPRGELPRACPGTASKTLHRDDGPAPRRETVPESRSRLSQWPVQIKLVPVHAPYFEDANLLVAADCTGYAFGDFHERFMKNHITLIGCPKLDEGDYTEKLTAIIRDNNIRSVAVARMEVPCCGGIENAVKRALQNSGKFIPWQVVTISVDGRILE